MFIGHKQIVNAPTVAMETKKEKIVRKVLAYSRNGWPEKPEVELLGTLILQEVGTIL